MHTMPTTSSERNVQTQNLLSTRESARGQERRVLELGHDVELFRMRFLKLRARSVPVQREHRPHLLFARDTSHNRCEPRLAQRLDGSVHIAFVMVWSRCRQYSVHQRAPSEEAVDLSTRTSGFQAVAAARVQLSIVSRRPSRTLARDIGAEGPCRTASTSRRHRPSCSTWTPRTSSSCCP